MISFADATLTGQPRGVASYYDMLAENAFGNFRKLLEDVALHPMMGIYLTWLGNQKEDPTTGRVPDLNFAREITQLFTIGEVKLNPDGTVRHRNRRQAGGGLHRRRSRAACRRCSPAGAGTPAPTSSDRTARRYAGLDADLSRDWKPMQAYNEYAPNTVVPLGHAPRPSSA